MAAPDPNVPDSVVLAQFKGLRNTISEERLAPTELAKAENIDIDDAGQVRRRRGQTLKLSGNCHSLFEATGKTLVVKDGVLGVLLPNYTFTSILTGVGPNRVAYVQVGEDVYFASQTVSGILHADNTVEGWGAIGGEGTWLSPIVNPSSTLFEIRGKLIGPPPMATELALYNGRIYLASGVDLWATELYLYKYVDRTKNFFQFESPITGLAAVSDGIYVGTETAVWFLRGTLNQMVRNDVMGFGMLPNSIVSVPAELVRPESSVSRGAILFMSNTGLCIGLDGGVTYNLTQERYLFPEATSVASLFRRQDGVNQYVGVADHGGTPVAAARFGDYVDAEIRRFQGA